MTKQFSNYSDLITFTRASKGHALRPVSYGSELVTNGDFSTDSDWTKGTGWTISNGVADLDGSQGGNSDLSQSLTLKANAIYQLSVEVTAVTTALQYVTITNTGGAELDSLSTTGTYTAIFVAPSTSENLNIRGTSSSVSTIDNVSVKEVLFDQPDGTLTLFEHPNNVPRVEWDADRNRLGLLVEESRTNLLTYSEDFSDSSWESVGTKVPNSAISPTGENNASLLSVDYLEIRPSVTSGTQYTYSIFVKALTDSTPQIIATGTSFPNTQANFDLTDGTVTSTTAEDATIQNYGNGWFRISITETATATDSTSRLRLFCEQAYIWGAQFEAGSFPTSYMKNEGTASGVTRSADVASIPVADFGYNQSEGTLFVEWKQSIGAASYVAMLSDGTATNRSMVRQFANGSAYYSTITNSVSQGDILTGTVVDNQSNKIGVVYKHNDAAGVLNGASAVTDATFLVPEGVSTLSIGSYTVGSSQYINGHIKKLMYIPRRVTNAQLISLTE